VKDLVILVCEPDSAMEGLGWGKFFPLVTGPFCGPSPVFHIMVVACSGFIFNGSGVMMRGVRSWMWLKVSYVLYILSDERY
jgi:hypothetical protein